MKRIAAIIALTAAVLAIPATAMASTGSSVSGGNPGYQTINPGGPRLVFCPLPKGIHVKNPGQAVQIAYAKGGRATVAYRKVDKRIGRFFCRVPRHLPKPPVQVCAPGTVKFDMPPSSGTFTEYSGPQLYAGEKFLYGGTKYTVASVSGAVFTLDANGSRYTNGGVSVVDGQAIAVCDGSSIGSSIGS